MTTPEGLIAGAVLALIGSFIGGTVTPLTLSWLEERVMMSLLGFQLHLEDGDEPLSQMVVHSAEKISNNDRLTEKILSALTGILPAWRIRSISAEQALSIYETKVEPV